MIWINRGWLCGFIVEIGAKNGLFERIQGGFMAEDGKDSVILKLCQCKRPFDVISGQPLRTEPNEWSPGTWKISSQPCKHCDPNFYIERALEHLNGMHPLKEAK